MSQGIKGTMTCHVWNCNKHAVYIAIKRNGRPYTQSFGYCEEHNNIVRTKKKEIA